MNTFLTGVVGITIGTMVVGLSPYQILGALVLWTIFSVIFGLIEA